jgi:hypothetical protein
MRAPTVVLYDVPIGTGLKTSCATVVDALLLRTAGGATTAMPPRITVTAANRQIVLFPRLPVMSVVPS